MHSVVFIYTSGWHGLRTYRGCLATHAARLEFGGTTMSTIMGSSAPSIEVLTLNITLSAFLYRHWKITNQDIQITEALSVCAYKLRVCSLQKGAPKGSQALAI